MKLRRPVTTFGKSPAQLKTKPAFWSFDSSSSGGFPGSEDARFLELKAYYSRPSGKGRFGKRPLSISLDQGGYSNDSNYSNSNDSGIDFNSYESRLSWCSEDANLGGRSSSISNLSSASSHPPQFSTSYGKKELKEDPKVERIINGNPNLLTNEGSVLNLLDISNTTPAVTPRFLPEKAQIVPQSMRLSPDSSDQVVNMVMTSPVMAGSGTHSPNSNSPTSSTLSPIPMKRPRFSYIPPVNCGKGATTSGTTTTGGLKLRNQNQAVRSSLGGKTLPPGTPPTLSSPLSSISRDGRAQLQIVTQPEEQHRARYQTEGSRGAIKDRKGNSFPTVKLVGYEKPATLQIFIGTDQGKVNPHMFYQACKVTGKSSTPCIEKKVEGTIVIEIEFEPSKDMVISCDCVGILKERNVDVEQRFPFHHAAQSRKKSTKCRMVYRTTIINSQGMEETLQLSSSPILCTQPPGHPEICKQSTHESSAKGGLELFVVGKNFLKDTKVFFQEEDADERILWEVVAEPLKDYLQQNHLICVIPPYKNQNIMSPVECKVTIVSGGKQSEGNRFTYLPNLPTAHYGISSPSSVSTNSPIGVIGLRQEDVMAQQSISHNQMIPMSISIQQQNGGGNDQERRNSLSSHSSLSPVHVGNSSQSILPASSLSPTRTTTMPALSFPESMHSVQAAQERQVVNELQCILDQSVQQQQSRQQITPEQQQNMITIKSEQQQQPFVSMSSMSQQNSMSATVPLDLQFPSAVVPVTTVESNNNNMVQVQPQMTFGGDQQQQIVSNASEFVVPPTTSLSCMGAPPTMSRQSSVEMINVEQRQQMLTDLIPNPMTMATVSQNTPNSAITVSCQQNLGGLMSNAVTSNGMCQLSMGGGIIKLEQQQPNPNNTTMNNPISMNAIVSVAASAATASGVGGGGIVVGPQQQNYNNPGDFQAHTGSIANALTQMSEHELINYINPSCFEQNLSLV